MCDFRGMRRQRKRACLVFLSLVAFPCVTMAQGRLLDDPDIASYRPRFPAPAMEGKKETTAAASSVALPTGAKVYRTPKLDVTWKLNRALDSVYQKNKQIKYAQGYRVLAYSGTDRNAMNEVKQKVYKLFPDVEIYSVFKQPEYRVTIGDFIDKLQAHEYLLKVIPQVPEALIIQDQINIIRK